MKKLLLTAIALMVVMGAFAQQKGESNVGISLGYNTGITNTKLTTTVKGSSLTEEHINREGDNFAIKLDYGYFVANNLRVGAALGYGYNANADSAIHSFTITPNVAYYVKLAPNFYYTPSLALGFGCSSTNERLVDLSGSDDKLTMSGFVSELKPFAVEFRPTQRFAMSVSLCSLQYVYLAGNIDLMQSAGVKIDQNTLAFNLLANAEVGFKVYF